MNRTSLFSMCLLKLLLLSFSSSIDAETKDPPDASAQGSRTEKLSSDETNEAPVPLESIEVIATTPISGSGIALEKIPANVQTADKEDLNRNQSLNLSDYLDRNLQGVNVNNAQSNPFQPDVRFRGFTASPLLGLPQGLSVYLNGLRFNEPFGDTVNWDLIPNGAIEQIELHPGSDPVYGLNTLGGALAVRTKTGFGAPGHHFRSLYGAWDRHDVELSSGWNNGQFGYFIDLRNFGENGWRDFSNSKVNQGFGSFSWQGEEALMNLTLAANESSLNGNGALPVQLREINPAAIFTHPDTTRTGLFLAALDGQWDASEYIEFSGNVFYRRNRVKTFNGDDSDFDECEDSENAGLLCEADGDEEEVVEDIHGNPVVASPARLGGTANFSQSQQESYGGSLQSAFTQDWFGLENQLILGGTLSQSVINFEFDSGLGSLTEDRGVIQSGVLLGEPRVRLYTALRNWGLYFSDTLSVTDELALSVSGRYNQSIINLQDRFGTELNGHHGFSRFNPAAGFTYTPMRALSFYGRYSESSRTPTPVELSCADPLAPCKLPNAFLADPPLKQVVAKTFESGFRGQIKPGTDAAIDWNAGYYHTTNLNDILFISAGNLTNQGFFSNVGATLRQGIEAGLTLSLDRLFSGSDQWRFALNYSWTEATFRTPFLASSPNNPLADDNGQIFVQHGDRLPGVPEHLVKFSTDVDLFKQLSLGFSLLYNSFQYYRGDEANLNDPVSGFVVFNLRGEWRVTDWIAFYGLVDNVFDRRYATFGLYGESDNVLGNSFDNPRFVSPGSPRAAWIGLKLSLL